MKSEEAKLFIKTPPEPQEVKLQKATRERRSLNIWKFLETHPGIRITYLATEVKYDQRNLDKYKQGKKTLPQHLLLKLESVLVKYGLNV